MPRPDGGDYPVEPVLIARETPHEFQTPSEASAKVALRRHGAQRRWQIALAVGLVAELVFFSLFADGFYSGWSSILGWTELFATSGILALGFTVVVISGGIDLSVGAIAALVAVVMAVLWQHGVPIWPAALIGLVLAIVLGCFNGLIILRLGVEPLISTLATNFMFGSLAVVIAGSSPPYTFPGSFTWLGQNTIGGVPVQLILFVGLTVAFGLMMTRTTFGRAVTMIGANRDAARYVGLPTSRVTVACYGISGLMAGVAGIVLGSYYGAANPNLGDPLLLGAVTIVVLGGVDIFGGEGSILGVALAALIVGFLQQGILTIGAQDVVSSMATGIVLILAVSVRVSLDRKQNRGRFAARVRRSRGKM